MGYRTYIQVVKKDIVLDLHNCKTIDDLLKVQEKHNLDCFEPADDLGSAFFKVYELPYREEFEFGKYCNEGRNTYNNTQDIFTTPELKELVSEDEFRFGGIEVIKAAIDWTENHIIKMYQNLIDCKSDWEWEQHKIDLMTCDERKEYHYEQLLNHCNDYLGWWKSGIADFHAYNDDRSKPVLAHTWLYEHTFWDLVRMWKEFDEENESVVFLGW